MAVPRILIVRLGAMGDILHALPAAATLRKSFPDAHLAWAVAPKWTDLLDGNGLVDEIIPFDRSTASGIRSAWKRLRAERFDLAIDFQGLVKSALVAASARAARVIGYERAQAREWAASLFYSEAVHATAEHVVDRNLELCQAAGATVLCHDAPLPPGKPEGNLPEGPFVIASPFAGWASKQWPVQRYGELALLLRERLGMSLVLNVSPTSEPLARSVPGVFAHVSSVAGLIDATRRATAVVGVDSGPMHLGAALHKPGVAIFGPTDPKRNGPYAKSFTVLRDQSAETTYKRDDEIAASMARIGAEQVMEALQIKLREGKEVQGHK